MAKVSVKLLVLCLLCVVLAFICATPTNAKYLMQINSGQIGVTYVNNIKDLGGGEYQGSTENPDYQHVPENAQPPKFGDATKVEIGYTNSGNQVKYFNAIVVEVDLFLKDTIMNAAYFEYLRTTAYANVYLKVEMSKNGGPMQTIAIYDEQRITVKYGKEQLDGVDKVNIALNPVMAITKGDSIKFNVKLIEKDKYGNIYDYATNNPASELAQTMVNLRQYKVYLIEQKDTQTPKP